LSCEKIDILFEPTYNNPNRALGSFTDATTQHFDWSLSSFLKWNVGEQVAKPAVVDVAGFIV
jgi:hypothetical protein